MWDSGIRAVDRMFFSNGCRSKQWNANAWCRAKEGEAEAERLKQGEGGKEQTGDNPLGL